MMWSLRAPPAVLGLVALAVLLPAVAAKPYPVHVEELRQRHNASQLVPRVECTSGVACGYYGQLCCASGDSCYTDANNEAQCGAAATPLANSGQWVYYTSTWVEQNFVTRTAVYSSYAGATALATPAPTGSCTGARSPCGTNGGCCDSGYYCSNPTAGTCALIGAGSSGGIVGTISPSAPLRPTSSGLIVVTATGSPTVTQAFETPVATGINGTLVQANGHRRRLSGGAIAGIVIGVLAGVLLLFLICFFCCARALLDTVLAIFGFGKKRKHTHEETYIEEHHHSSGGGAAGGGRRWYGQAAGRPSRPKKESKFGGMLGVGAALGAAALALGLKRRHDRKHDDKSTVVSGSTGYYSDYTSSSE
ncbi:hypothetical protein P154DRAFT_113118 [Amniculicola lignicola CBS 123094]|uniref:Uncharacterized protein n=1 Tax=Amniculicola lignicola CBS 123094 TaxID=1392246 RepID=A0A6A5VT17_9PLEO|nr:hypothetical protein P154DRAFT_113118 [Amniculicola lignicola CBS 123094]